MASGERYPVWVFRDLGDHGNGWTAWRTEGGGDAPQGGLRFATLEEAVAWASARSGCVLVNVDRDRRRPTGWWSAGADQPEEGGPYPAWPPRCFGVRLALEGLPDAVVDAVPAAVAAAPALASADVRLRPAGPGSVRVSFEVEGETLNGAEQAGMDAFFPALDRAWAATGEADGPLFFTYRVTPRA